MSKILSWTVITCIVSSLFMMDSSVKAEDEIFEAIVSRKNLTNVRNDYFDTHNDGTFAWVIIKRDLDPEMLNAAFVVNFYTRSGTEAELKKLPNEQRLCSLVSGNLDIEEQMNLYRRIIKYMFMTSEKCPLTSSHPTIVLDKIMGYFSMPHGLPLPDCEKFTLIADVASPVMPQNVYVRLEVDVEVVNTQYCKN